MEKRKERCVSSAFGYVVFNSTIHQEGVLSQRVFVYVQNGYTARGKDIFYWQQPPTLDLDV